MSFFDTEEFHAVVLARGADRGGRSAPQVTPASVHLEISIGTRRPPGSSVKSRLIAPASFGAKKDIHIPNNAIGTELKQ
jgi:hypothetical protein